MYQQPPYDPHNQPSPPNPPSQSPYPQSYTPPPSPIPPYPHPQSSATLPHKSRRWPWIVAIIPALLDWHQRTISPGWAKARYVCDE